MFESALWGISDIFCVLWLIRRILINGYYRKELSHIANATLEEVKAFFFRFYAPNNAILAVTGNISFEEAVALTEKWFGSIPRREVPQRNLPQEQEQTEERRLTVERNVSSRFFIYGIPHACPLPSGLLCI